MRTVQGQLNVQKIDQRTETVSDFLLLSSHQDGGKVCIMLSEVVQCIINL